MRTKLDNGSNTKRGPGRIHVQGTGKKTAKQRAAGAYGAGLMAHFAAKRRDALAKRGGLRDEYGAFTLRGRPHPFQAPQLIYGGRKVWLAGISAQLGY